MSEQKGIVLNFDISQIRTRPFMLEDNLLMFNKRWGVNWQSDECYCFNGINGWTAPTFSDALDSASQAGVEEIITETAFETFNTEEHNRLVDKAHELGILLFVYPNKASGIAIRKKIEYHGNAGNLHNIHQQDEHANAKLEGAILLYEVRDTPQGQELKKATHYTGEGPLWDYMKAVKLRTNKYKGVEADRLRNYLPPFKELQQTKPEIAKALADGNKYCNVLTMDCLIAAEGCNSRKEFDRAVGFYANGYPNLARSDFYHWRVKTIAKRLDGVRKMEDVNPATTKQAMRMLRKASRWIYSQVKSTGRTCSEMGRSYSVD